MKEAEIQRAVFRHITTRGQPGLYVFHVPNGGYRRRTEAAILKGIGVRCGVPDVWLKAEGGRPTEAQLEAVEAIRNAGGFAAITYGLERAIRCLEVWRLLRGQM